MQQTNKKIIIKDIDKKKLLRKSLGMFSTGITVVTTLDQNKNPVGMTVNSFASVSLNPALVLWSIEKKQPSFNTFFNANGYAVNVLTKKQHDLCTLFSSPVENKFENINWHLSENGHPIINDTLAWFDCIKWNYYNGGDHQILVSEVLSHNNTENEPLVYWNSNIS
jgi:flavin reductase (DIM6/NTAB) family NADH-FMN oxidoreductase RutF